MSKFKEIIENCLKEYDPEDDGDKTWTNRSEWNNYFNQKKLKSLERSYDKVNVVMISKDLYSGKELRRLYVKEPRNGFDKTFDKKMAKIFTRKEAEEYLKTHEEKTYPKEDLLVVHEIESI